MNISEIRKKASLALGRKYLEDPVPDSTAVILLQKAASADQELLKIASRLPGDTLENYEELGGTFSKQALGAPMFAAGAPAQPQQPQAIKPLAPKIPGTAPSLGGGAGGGIPNASVPSQPAPAAPSVKAAAARMQMAMKKEKEANPISSTRISMMQQAFPPPTPAAGYAAQGASGAQ